MNELRSAPIQRASKLNILGIELDSIANIMTFCKSIASSECIPSDKRGQPSSVFLALQAGFEVGLTPHQSLQQVIIVNGRTTLMGDAMSAIVHAHPDFEEMEEELINGDKDIKEWVYRITVKRSGRKPLSRQFSYKQAMDAGLIERKGKNGGKYTPVTWKNYPERMLRYRALGFALRDYFPDVFCSIISTEEAKDYPLPAANRAAPVTALVDQGKVYHGHASEEVTESVDDETLPAQKPPISARHLQNLVTEANGEPFHVEQLIADTELKYELTESQCEALRKTASLAVDKQSKEGGANDD